MRLRGAMTWGIVVAVLGLAAAVGFVREFSGDFHWHVVLGEHLLDTGSLYAHDLHSATARGEPMFNTSWLGDVALAAAFRGGGYAGAYLVRALALVAMAALLMAEARRRGVSVAVAATMVVTLLANSSFLFYLRPETLAFALLAAMLATLGAHQRTGRARYLGAAVALLALWANVHGSVGIGLMVLGVYCAQRLVDASRRRKQEWSWRSAAVLAAVPALGFAAACANPHGIWLPLAFTRVQPLHTETVREYLPITIATMPALMQVAGLVIAGSAAAAFALARRTSAWHGVAFLVLAVFAHRYQRFATYALIVAIPWVADNLALAAAALEQRGELAKWRRLGAVATGLAAATALGVLFVGRGLAREVGIGLDERAKVFPIEACRFVRDQTVPAPLLNSYDFGSYLMFCLGPDYPLFIDQRAQSLYSEAFYRRYRDAARTSRAATAFADEYGAAWAMVGPDPFAAALAGDRRDWSLLYFDDKAEVYARVGDPRTAEAIEAHGFRWLSPDYLPALTDLPPALREQAIAELARQRQRCPDCYRTDLVGAALAIASGDEEGYDEAMSRLLDHSETAQVAFLGARHAIGRGDLEGAAVLFDRFAALGGDRVVAVTYRARGLAAAGRTDEARALVDAAVGLPDPGHVLARLREELGAGGAP